MPSSSLAYRKEGKGSGTDLCSTSTEYHAYDRSGIDLRSLFWPTSDRGRAPPLCLVPCALCREQKESGTA